MKKTKKYLLLGTLFMLCSCGVTDTSNTSKESYSNNNSSILESGSSSQTTENNNSSVSLTTSSTSSSNKTSTTSSTNSNSSSNSGYFVTSYDDSKYENYYKSVNLNAKGDSLVRALGDLIASTHNAKSYDALWEGYKLGDIRPGTNYLWDMYSNCNFNAYNPPQGKYSKEGDAVNREHSVPQSWFSKKSPMKSDYYHVVPTDGYVNNRRSNYPFGEVGNATYTSQNGSKVGSSKISGISGTVFEPIDEYKGDFARIYFYMCTRYYTQVGSWSGGVFQSSFPYIKSNYFNLYLQWAKDDPVSDKERMRNEGGYQFQGNRNPYVDYPELLYQAFDSNYVIVEKTDQEKANEIIALINNIGEVTLNSKSAIDQARKSYDSASKNVQDLVTNYETLLNAESTYQSLLEDISGQQGQSATCTFTDKDFTNSLDYSFKSSVTPSNYESERGVQFLKQNDITITTSSYQQAISSITIITSSNQNTYSYDVSVNGVDFVSIDNTVESGEKNKELVFNATGAYVGEVKIHITASSQNKSLWIKSIIFN